MRQLRHALWILVMGVALMMGASGGVWAQSVHQQLGTYVVAKGQTFVGNITLNAGTVDVLGRVDGNVTVDLGTVDVSGVVTGNVTVGAGSIVIGPNGRIEGQRTVKMGTNNERSVGIVGAVNQMGWTSGLPWWANTIRAPSVWWSGLTKLAINLVVTGLLVTLLPSFLNKVTEEMDHDGVAATGIGCLGVIGLAVALLGLTIIIIGIPVAFLLGVAAVVGGIVANASLVWWLGMRVSRIAWPEHSRQPYREILVGALVLTVVEILPWVGGLIGVVLELLAFGALLRMMFLSNRHRWPLYPRTK